MVSLEQYYVTGFSEGTIDLSLDIEQAKPVLNFCGIFLLMVNYIERELGWGGGGDFKNPCAKSLFGNVLEWGGEVIEFFFAARM